MTIPSWSPIPCGSSRRSATSSTTRSSTAAAPSRSGRAHASGLVELYVADDGAGVPPEFVARAFDRFSRPDDGRSSRGIGLGLSIVELIARAHGGEARVGTGPRAARRSGSRCPPAPVERLALRR